MELRKGEFFTEQFLYHRTGRLGGDVGDMAAPVTTAQLTDAITAQSKRKWLQVSRRRT